MRINLTDNNIGQSNSGTFFRKDVAALFPIADKTVAQLCRENENLLIFPYSVELTDDKVGDSSVMRILNTNDSDKVRLVKPSQPKNALIPICSTEFGITNGPVKWQW